MEPIPLTAELVEEHAEEIADHNILHIGHDLTDVRLLSTMLAATAASVRFVPIQYARHSVPTDSVDSKHGQAVREAASAFSADGRPWLVIEDGGRFWDAIHEPKIDLQLEGLCGIVEQTSAGEIRARMRMGFPQYPATVSIARSIAKTRIENHFIAERVWEETSLLLGETGNFLQYKPVALVGYGVLGRSVAHKLRARGCDLSILDLRPDCVQAALDEGFAVADVPTGIRRDVSAIVGVTGRPSVGLNDVVPVLSRSDVPVVLISASSRRVEFSDAIESIEAPQSGWELTRHTWGDEYVPPPQMPLAPLRLLGQGYPINFFRPGSDSLANRVADLVAAELVVASAAVASLGNQISGVEQFGRSRLERIAWPIERELISRWCLLNGVSRDAAIAGGVPAIGPHPCETALAQSMVHVQR